MIRRLKSDPSLLDSYHSVFVDYAKQGMIESARMTDSNVVRFLPHRPVVRSEKATTKIRPVFDASASDDEGMSLNGMLLPGPNLLPDLFHVLVRFRAYPVSLIADIEKAFLQIGIRNEDRDALRFLWFDTSKPLDHENPGDLKEYRWTRLPFGLTSSPFLLQATVRHHLGRCREKEIVSQIISENIYVDDLVLSVKDVQAAILIKDQVQEIFKKCSMNMRKWASNEISLNDTQNETEIKVLGLHYNAKLDSISIACSEHKIENPTKRQVLQSIASIFDPLGLVAPVITSMKLFFQKIIRLNIGWDELIPSDLVREWGFLRDQLSQIEKCPIERWVQYQTKGKLHLFCDASMKAYGAVVYVVNAMGESRLLTAKSKLSPSKSVTLPRLELMAACLGSLLLQSVCDALKCKVQDTICWTDSKIVLAWINHDKNDLKQFVGNRVQIIQQHSLVENWHHVRSELNPADLISRGSSIEKLLHNKLWWNGPPLDGLSEQPYYQGADELSGIAKEALRKQTVVHAVIDNESFRVSNVIDVTRFSSWNKLLRVTARVMKFLNRCRRLGDNSDISSSDLLEAEDLWIKDMQDEWKQEIASLQQGDRLSSGSKLSQLHPFVDSNGFLRSTGRLQNAEIDENVKHPLIVSNSHLALKLLILHHHSSSLHGGTQTVAYRLRQKFIIFKMIKTIKLTIRSCVTCRKSYLKSYAQPTPPLPNFRVDESQRVFEAVGIDFTGPLHVKERDEVRKTYVLLFTCAVFRAVHLELLDDMSYRELMHGLSMFFARRGTPRLILSDNAKSFVKARTEFLRSSAPFEWRMIPERAPWYGGFWERLMSVIKTPLRKTLGNSLISKRKMTSLLAQVESVVNDRPLTSVSADPRDPLPLTPNHFLRVNSIDNNKKPVSIPPLVEFPKEYRGLQSLLRHFTSRFRREYFTALRAATPESQGNRGAKVGDLVLLPDTRSKCFNWPLGLIVKLFPGKDGRSRVALVKTKNSVLRRATQGLIHLEGTRHLNEEDEETPEPADETDDPEAKKAGNETTIPAQVSRTRSGRATVYYLWTNSSSVFLFMIT